MLTYGVLHAHLITCVIDCMLEACLIRAQLIMNIAKTGTTVHYALVEQIVVLIIKRQHKLMSVKSC